MLPDPNQPPPAANENELASLKPASDSTPTIQRRALTATEDVSVYIAAPEPVPEGERTVLTVRSGDTLDRLFRRNNLSIVDMTLILRDDVAAKHLRLIRPGDEIVVFHNGDEIVQLDREIDYQSSLRINRNETDFEAILVEHALVPRLTEAEGTIKSSLYEAGAAAGVSDRAIMNLANIFAWDIDFVLDIRQGDSFRLITKELWRDGRRVSEGEVVAAEFINQGEKFQAVRYEDPNGDVSYYTPDGRNMRKAFLRAPLQFSRISSNFNPNRRHPVLNTIRAHKGVDYAAASGTPIMAAGDGKVIFRGTKGGYGQAIILQHGGNITTLYAHMLNFNRNVRNGTRVKQGQTIGYVGQTGLASGPHLHYEYRKNGVHMNPRTVKLPHAEPIDGAFKDDFVRSTTPILQRLGKTRGLIAETAQTSVDRS
jgi:murein DD-endopeptidase MepM/ murein hydrolase activator NlpD